MYFSVIGCFGHLSQDILCWGRPTTGWSSLGVCLVISLTSWLPRQHLSFSAIASGCSFQLSQPGLLLLSCELVLQFPKVALVLSYCSYIAPAPHLNFTVQPRPSASAARSVFLSQQDLDQKTSSGRRVVVTFLGGKINVRSRSTYISQSLASFNWPKSGDVCLAFGFSPARKKGGGSQDTVNGRDVDRYPFALKFSCSVL